MKNLTDTSIQFCKSLKDKGFNGVHFDNIKMDEYDDHEREEWDEENPDARFEDWTRDYASFIGFPDFPSPSLNDSIYIEDAGFDEESFYSDFQKHLDSFFGIDIKITYGRYSGQFEAQRLGDKATQKQS